MILIITGKRDGHVAAVSKHLDDAGVPWVRINVEDFATNVEVEVTPATGAGRLRVIDSGKEIPLEEVAAVWFRKPDPVTVQHFDMDPAALEYVEAEFNEIILGLYAMLNRAYWINNPFDTRIAHRKLLQLRTAAEVGFAVPKTLVTNRPEAALGFADQVNGDLAIKSLGAISVMQDQGGQAVQYGIFTRRTNTAELIELSDKIGHMPTLFQEFIPKTSELRITCVGKQIFACKIQTRTGDITSDDYRFDTPNLEHTAIECPELTSRLNAYMSKLGLNFGCFDFIVPESGEAVFLECNCNGQWYWVEERTGQPISLAIASQLLQHSKVDQNYGVFFTNHNGKILWERGRRTEIADLSGARLRRQEFTVARGPSGEVYKGDERAS
jgi:glutathione synthase/RimK-type ligase-like ATP-grasp enzyme